MAKTEILVMKIYENADSLALQIGNCVHKKRRTVILGLSPGNGYFKKDIIKELINFSAQEFTKVCIFIPDFPAAHTYRAIGYSDRESHKKARNRGNNLRNHCLGAIENVH